MQGTAGVAVAGLLGAVRAQGRSMIDFPKQKIVVAGAGRLALYSHFLLRRWNFNGVILYDFDFLCSHWCHVDLH